MSSASRLSPSKRFHALCSRLAKTYRSFAVQPENAKAAFPIKAIPESTTPVGSPKKPYPSLTAVATVFVSSFFAALLYGFIDPGRYERIWDNRYYTIHPSAHAIMKGDKEDYVAGILFGLSKPMTALDWAVLGTHYQKADRAEYAFHCFYLVYLDSLGQRTGIRDWAHEALFESVPLESE